MGITKGKEKRYLLPWNLIPTLKRINSKLFNGIVPVGKQKEKASGVDGKWLMAGRVKPEGEQRRDISRSRKTMKFLIDGFFQWTAFNTETFQFFGSGGGTIPPR